MKNKKIFSIILIIFILCLIIGAWYIYSGKGDTQIKRPEETTCENKCGDGTCQEVVCQAIGCPCSETSTTCPQDCLSQDEVDKKEPDSEEDGIDETANWKTYKSDKHNFEVKYHNSWHYHVSEFKEVNRDMICFNPKEISEDFCYIVLMVDWDTPFEEMYITTKQTMEQLNLVTESITSSNNIEWQVITIDVATGLSKSLFTKRNNNVYNFAMETGNETIFDHMLSTFQFSE